MSSQRPDPDALLAKVQRDEAAEKLGKLKIFFGANAGVGKTFAMLAAGHAAQREGRAVCIGIVETHGRVETEAIARDLPRLPLAAVPHRGQTLHEFDLDAALAWSVSQPGGVLLLDELAHSNAPGSRHAKRWQDAQELRNAGVEVWTTLNVQHLESLNDVVGGITGIRVWETLPDRVFDSADEVVVVDLPPDELLQRLREGKVYLPAQAERAAQNFFRKGNLLALRELALRRTADRVDGQMQAYRREHRELSAGAVWPNRESLLACVGPGAASDKVVRNAARLAQQLGIEWHAVHVQTAQPLAENARLRVQRTLELAQSLGARTAELSAPEVATALVGYAREHNLARLVVGRRERAWRWPGRPALAEALSRLAEDMDVLQVALPSVAAQRRMPAPRGLLTPQALRGHLAALAGVSLTTGISLALLGFMAPTNIAMLYLLNVVGVALRFGRSPAALAALLGVAAFDFAFVEPRWSFAVGDAQYLVTFAVLLLVGLVIGQLAAGLQAQARAARERERRVRGLYAMSRDLGAALVPEQVADIATRFVRAEFGVACAVLAPPLAAAPGREVLAVLPGAGSGGMQPDLGVAQWAFDHGQPAGLGTDTLPASPCLMLPLTAPMRRRGVLAVQGRVDSAGRRWSTEERELLETCASLLAISLERIHYIDVAQQSTLQIEGERLRNSLLTAISHDLRTPLAALVGLADALGLTALQPQQVEVASAMRRSALRMSALVSNLLDMARLQSGAVQLNRQWLPLQEVVGSALGGLDEALSGCEVTVDLPPDLPLLELDAVLIERVLVNLLENAAKYGGGSIRISARTAGRYAEIDVTDNGPGFPPGREAQLFDKFERGDRESATPGVGLGLAICKAIVDAHGGRVSAHNQAAGGSCVRVELPLGQPPQ